MISLNDFENWGVLMRPGSPGDVFRLLHGLNCRLPNACWCVICDAADVPGIPRVIDGAPLKISDENRWTLWKTRKLYWLAFKGLQPRKSPERCIVDFTKKWNNCFHQDFAFGAEHIWTSYSDSRSKQQGHRNSLPGNIHRVDCVGACNEFASTTADFKGIPLYKKDDEDELQVAVVLRGDGRGYRDSPPYHKDIKFLNETLGKGLSIRYHFFGYPTDDDPRWPKFGKRVPYGETSIFDQIIQSQKFHLAMGVNSSALDLFSIAGVPVLRECEFQGVMKTCWPFKRRYNSFLCGNLNIGLGIHPQAKGSYAWRDKKKLEYLFRLVVDRSPWKMKPVWGNAPRHLHVEPSLSRDKIKKKVTRICQLMEMNKM